MNGSPLNVLCVCVLMHLTGLTVYIGPERELVFRHRNVADGRVICCDLIVCLGGLMCAEKQLAHD